MTADDLAAVVAAVTSLVAVGALTAVLMRTARVLREASAAIAEVRRQAAADLDDAAAELRQASAEVARVAEILDAAEAISSRVDGASRAAYVALSRPVIKTAAAATGAQRAARRLRGRE